MQVIAPTVAPAAATVPDELVPDDPFHDPRLKWVGLVLVLTLMAGVFAMGAVYYGSAYHVPSWSAASVPPPIAHKVK